MYQQKLDEIDDGLEKALYLRLYGLFISPEK
jgi:hypothetical protein